MPQSSPGSPNPFAVTPQPEPRAGERATGRERHISLPIQMDDGEVRTFDLPAALDHAAQFSESELDRLRRAYADALGLIDRT